MGVRGKALRFAILTSAILLASGCAVHPSPTVEEETIPTEVASAENESLSDTLESEALDVTAQVRQLAPEKTQLVARAQDVGSQVTLERGAGFSRYIIGVEGEQPAFDVMMLENPSRLVLDVLGRRGKVNEQVAVDDQFLGNVRFGAHPDRARIVFDLKGKAASGEASHFIDQGPGQIVLTFFDENLITADVPKRTLPETAIAQTEEVEEVVEVAAKPAVEPSSQELLLDSLKFEKGQGSSGVVRVGLSDQAAFELKRSAPSEYVLSIPGARAAQRTTIPQIAPKGFPGIRAARAVQQGGNVQIRMFVDAGVKLSAAPARKGIVITANADPIAARPDARAQLEVGEGGLIEGVRAQLEESGDEGGADDSVARLNPTGIRSSDGTKVYTGRLISLDLQDTDIDNALRIIAEVSNLNIIASDDVSGKVTLRLIDVPWDQALDVILKTNGLDQVTEGNVIRIAPVDKLRQEREALREARRAKEALEDLSVNYLRISYARAQDLREQVESVLSERGSVIADERTNQIIVKDIQKGQQRARELISRLDLRTPQVLLETQIIEGERNILRDLGFQWNFNFIQSPATGNATGYNFPNSVSIGGSTTDGANDLAVNFPASIGFDAGSAISAVLDSADGSRSLTGRLTALENEGKVKVISRPQVATVNNKTAEISSVETVRVRLPDSGTSVGIGQGATSSGGGSSAFEEIDVGIELTVTPQASPDYYVLLDIEAKSSTFGSTVVDNIPSTLDREATSTILVKSGQTFAPGGVYRIEDSDQVQGVPFLKDIPFIGYLFRRTFVNNNDEELIFFITPHIVEGSFDPSLM